MLLSKPLFSRGRFGKYRLAFAMAVCLFVALPMRAATGGSISGTLADPSGAAIPGAVLNLVNTAQQTIYRAVSDKQGFYSFPNLPVGRYDLTISAHGFATQRKTNLTVDTDSALRLDAHSGYRQAVGHGDGHQLPARR